MAIGAVDPHVQKRDVSNAASDLRADSQPVRACAGDILDQDILGRDVAGPRSRLLPRFDSNAIITVVNEAVRQGQVGAAVRIPAVGTEIVILLGLARRTATNRESITILLLVVGPSEVAVQVQPSEVHPPRIHRGNVNVRRVEQP